MLPRSLLSDPLIFDLVLIRVGLNFLATLLRYFVKALHVPPVSFALILSLYVYIAGWLVVRYFSSVSVGG